MALIRRELEVIKASCDSIHTIKPKINQLMDSLSILQQEHIGLNNLFINLNEEFNEIKEENIRLRNMYDQLNKNMQIIDEVNKSLVSFKNEVDAKFSLILPNNNNIIADNSIITKQSLFELNDYNRTRLKNLYNSIFIKEKSNKFFPQIV